MFLGVRVCLYVCSQVGPVCERAAAIRAAERPFAGVRTNVTLQEPGTTERLAADGAFTRERVSPNVHLQSSQTHVILIAILTRKLPGTAGFACITAFCRICRFNCRNIIVRVLYWCFTLFVAKFLIAKTF